MENNNQENSPFTPPKASLETEQAIEYDTSSPFSPKGRFGRVDYIAYSIGMAILMMIGISGFTAVLTFSGVTPDIAGIITIILVIPVVVFSIIFMVRRLHDLNWSGWIAVTYFIPVLNAIIPLLLIVLPGTPGPNKYAAQRMPPSKGKIVIACLLPAIAILGILAAIAIPAYQDYLVRAQGG